MHVSFFTGHLVILDGHYAVSRGGNLPNNGNLQYPHQKGHQLQKMQKSGETVEFVYNENGLRVQKTATTTGVTKYTLHGKNVVHMTQGSNELHFFYDAQNKPAVVVYNGTPYSYVKNLQGDIVAILNSAGTVVVSYKYDAWGRPISKTGSMAATLGTVQPFRYRGYVYDEETGLYYLRSRYYCVTIHRFLNLDCILTHQGLLNFNLFTYCKNNPICKTDACGFESITDWSYVEIDGEKAVRADPVHPIDGHYYIFSLTEEQRVDVRGYVDISHAKVQPATQDGVTEKYIGLYIGSIEQFEFHFVDRATGTVYAGRIATSKCVLGDEVSRAEFYFGINNIENTGSGERWQAYNIQNAINNMIRQNAFKYSKIELDGVFGTETTNAVKALQRQYKLSVDGVVGPVTRNILVSYAVAPYTEAGW